MSRISLNTNISSLNTQRNFANSTRQLSDTFLRLSSGLRINKASDDAAGLSISSLLNVDKRVFMQGIRNLNDGLSSLSIAEGALGELTNILFRIAEIAEQSANGTLSSKQREPLQEEVTALQNEYNRIIKSVDFNGMQLLTGENAKMRLQGGYGSTGSLFAEIGNSLISEAFGLLSAGTTTRVSTTSSGGEIGGDGSGINSMSGDGRYVLFTSSENNII